MVRREGFGLPAYLAFAAATVFTLLVCVSLGSVKLPLRETFGLLWNALAGRGTGTGMSATIVFSVRLPRVLCVALTGALFRPSARTVQQGGIKTDRCVCGSARDLFQR